MRDTTPIASSELDRDRLPSNQMEMVDTTSPVLEGHAYFYSAKESNYQAEEFPVSFF
jgi:hypothetical protein